MLTTAMKFADELRKLIEEEYQRTRDNLAAGSAQDHGEYLRQVGYISALGQVIELMELAQTNAEKR